MVGDLDVLFEEDPSDALVARRRRQRAQVRPVAIIVWARKENLRLFLASLVRLIKAINFKLTIKAMRWRKRTDVEMITYLNNNVSFNKISARQI